MRMSFRGGVDVCLGCGHQCFALSEATSESKILDHIFKKFPNVVSIGLWKGFRWEQRVKVRACPKCGSIMKPIPITRTGDFPTMIHRMRTGTLFAKES